MRHTIDVEYVQQRYTYDAEEECLRDNESGRVKKLRTTREYGYARMIVNKISYTLSRLVWAIVKGEDPGDLVIDHIDRDKSNNTIDNLRCVTQSDNNRNRVCTYQAPEEEAAILMRALDAQITQEYLAAK